MKTFFFFLIFLPSLLMGAEQGPCSLGVGDGDPPDVIEHAVVFRGPSNGFWQYVSDDPASWVFEIVSSKNPKIKTPTFERISVRRPDGEFVRFEKHLRSLPNHRFTFDKSTIEEFVKASAEALRKIRKNNPIAYPTASAQVLTMFFEFKSAGAYEESWLNHECGIGFGLNTLSGKLVEKVGKGTKKKANFDFTIDVNNPSLDSTNLRDKIPAKTNASGKFVIKGLPMGTFIADLLTPNKKSAIAFMDELPRHCEWEVQKEPASENDWTVLKNTCPHLTTPGR